MTFAPSISPEPDDHHDAQRDCFLPLPRKSAPAREPEIYTFHSNAHAASHEESFHPADATFYPAQNPGPGHPRDRSPAHSAPGANQLHNHEWRILHGRRTQFQEARRDLMDRLSRSIVELEDGAVEALRLAEAKKQAAESFRRHLAVIETIHPENWADHELHLELSRAQAIVDEAHEDFHATLGRLDGAGSKTRRLRFPMPNLRGAGFFDALRAGFGFWLPILILGIVALILIVTALGK